MKKQAVQDFFVKTFTSVQCLELAVQHLCTSLCYGGEPVHSPASVTDSDPIDKTLTELKNLMLQAPRFKV